jgi:bacterioferritin
MKGNEKLIERLNDLLSDEMTAINQYMVHAEMAQSWGYQALHKLIRDRAVTEMKHMDALIERILFLEGRPIVSRLKEIRIAAEVPGMFQNDLGLEMGAVRAYNEAVKLAVEVGDNATKDLLEKILRDEDAHVDEIEGSQDRIQQMGLQVYLSTQTEKNR